MRAKLPEKDLGPFRLKSYNNKAMFHSKDAYSKNGLRTKKSDLEPIFFSCPSVKRHVGFGAYSITKALKTGLPRVLDALHEWRICFQVSCIGRVLHFFLVSRVFSSNIP